MAAALPESRKLRNILRIAVRCECELYNNSEDRVKPIVSKSLSVLIFVVTVFPSALRVTSTITYSIFGHDFAAVWQSSLLLLVIIIFGGSLAALIWPYTNATSPLTSEIGYKHFKRRLWEVILSIFALFIVGGFPDLLTLRSLPFGDWDFIVLLALTACALMSLWEALETFIRVRLGVYGMAPDEVKIIALALMERSHDGGGSNGRRNQRVFPEEVDVKWKWLPIRGTATLR
jgi:hypothetical protein